MHRISLTINSQDKEQNQIKDHNCTYVIKITSSIQNHYFLKWIFYTKFEENWLVNAQNRGRKRNFHVIQGH